MDDSEPEIRLSPEEIELIQRRRSQSSGETSSNSPLAPAKRITVSRRTALGIGLGLGGAAAAGGFIAHEAGKHDSVSNQDPVTAGPVNPDQGEKKGQENNLTPEQEERDALRPVLAVAKVYKPGWSQPGGNSTENIDQDALQEVAQELLENQVYVMETGDKDALKYIYQTDPSTGVVSKQQFSKQLKAIDVECARNKKYQEESPYQPVESISEVEIVNFGTIGRDTITADISYIDRYFGKPKDSKSGGEPQVRKNVVHFELGVQHRTDPETKEADMPAFVISKSEDVASFVVQS